MITQAAIDNRDDGISRAIAHANRASAEWQDRATEMLGAFMLANRREFMAEEVRAWAERHGLPKPPDSRSWGAVMLAASKGGTIRSLGYFRQGSANCHGSAKNLWVAA